MDQVTEEEAKKQRDLHHHALRGDVVEVGGMDVAHNIEENNPHSEKAKEKKEEREHILHMVLEAQEAYDALMGRLNAELELLQKTIGVLEEQMNDNRLVWDFSLSILNEIDELFCDFEDGEFDSSKAFDIVSSAGCEIPEDATDAEMLALLQEIRVQHLENVESLDVDFLVLEADHKRFKLREGQVLAAKEQLEKIGGDRTLNDDQRLKAIQNLDREVGSKTLHTTATQIENKELTAKVDEVVLDDLDDQQASKTHNPLASFGMN